MDKTKWNEIQAILFFAVALLIFISLATFTTSDIPLFTSHVNAPLKNFAGLLGAYLAAGLFFIMGLSAFIIPLLVLTWAAARLSGVTPQKLYFKIFGTFFLILASSSIFSIIGRGDNAFRFRLGGIVGLSFSDFLIQYLGRGGALIVIAVLFLLSILLATEFLLLPFLSGLLQRVKAAPGPVPERRFGRAAPAGDAVAVRRARTLQRDDQRRETPPVPKPAPVPPAPEKKRPEIVIAKPIPPAPKPKEREVVTVSKRDPSGYTLPGIDLLDSPPPIEERQIKDNLEENAAILEETLRDFDIESKVVACNKGPVITRYELEPAPGVKIHRITSLGDNIALAMKAQSVRIVAPIPGKGTIGVEVPNSSSTLVYLKEILNSKEYRDAKSKLKLALGKDIAGSPVLADLSGMPHLLIAGATGSGKTVCVNGVITSLLMNSTPDEIKFIMIDPKRVELAAFNGLPHLLAPVVTDSKKTAGVLEWLVAEMEGRYELFAKAAVRNIDMYNEKAARGPAGQPDEMPKRIPYIIVIIDELADLMMVARQDVEGAIARLAQLSRAVGIHMVIATQRPSVDVITGVIKANFPARISFKVASKVDSRTVLDMNGADKLLGRGDMLFVEPGAAKPVRAQASLIADREIERIVNFIKAQRGPSYVEGILDEQKKSNFKKFDKDEVYEEAVRLILETQQASVSVLQRRLGLGYTRAARLMDMMEQEGIVGPYQGSKPRDVLTTIEEYRTKNG